MISPVRVGVIGTGFGARVVAPVFSATDGCTVVFAFSIGPLGHFFLARFHLGDAPPDLGPGTAGE